MRLRYFTTIVVLAILAFGGNVAVSGTATRKPPAHFELLHLWITNAESRALAALSDPVEAAGVVWEEHRYRSSYLGLKNEYAERLALDRPPTGTHWIGGRDLKAMVDAGIFRLVTDRPGRPSYHSTLLPEVYDVISHRDGITALPLGIHLQNHLAYNSEIFSRLGVAVPNTWDDLIEAAKVIKNAGYVPLTMSDQRWQLRFLFAAILVGYMSPDDFMELIEAKKVTDRQRSALSETFKIIDALRPYVNADHRDLGWSDATNHLIRGEAAMQILSDFTSPLYADDPKIVCRSAPQSSYVVWALDSVALTRTDDPADVAGQDVFIEAASSVRNLQRYIREKGGLPVYKWKELEGINSCSRQSASIWTNSARKVHIGTAWTMSLNIMGSVVQKFWRDPSANPRAAVEEVAVALENLNSTVDQ